MVRVTTCSRHCPHILILFLNLCFTDMRSIWCRHRHRSAGGFRCKIFSWVSSAILWSCQVHSFHKCRQRLFFCVVSFPVDVVQKFFDMIYLQPDCSIPPSWWCLSHLFHLLQEFLQLYLKILALSHLHYPMLTCTLTPTKHLRVMPLFEEK